MDEHKLFDEKTLTDSQTDREYFGRLAQKIHRLVEGPVRLMEVCGTHTMAIGRFGIRQALPPEVELVSGPGCPVCVTSDAEIDGCLELAARPGVILATYGDMVRVPGSKGSLAEMKALGADIRVVYSPLEALAWARREPQKEVVFLGVGFETTAPATAHAVLTARQEKLANFSVYNLHKTVPPALAALLEDPALGIQGLILPGHVSAIIGEEAYGFIKARAGISGVIAGFRAPQIMAAILQLILLHRRGEQAVVNQYPGIVRREGNPAAQKMLREVFQPCDANWRGLGIIPGSGLRFRQEFDRFDAAARFGIETVDSGRRNGCRCGDILKGLAKPPACPHFGRSCTPDRPVGPCMVSSEGTCAAYFLYEGGMGV